MADSNEEETPQQIPKLHDLIFPPKNHENLHISPSFSFPSSTSLTSTSSTTSSSTWDDTSPPSSPTKNFNNSDVTPNWASWGLLFGRVNGFVRFLRSFGFVRGLFLIFQSPIGTLLLFLYFRWWRKRRRRMMIHSGDGGNQHLLRVILEKDERINELLTQIARMNEVLLSMHKVPSSNGG